MAYSWSWLHRGLSTEVARSYLVLLSSVYIKAEACDFSTGSEEISDSFAAEGVSDSYKAT